MILWNTASKKIEARFDGKVFEFSPNEQKKIHNEDVTNHLYMKLEKYGLVLLGDDAGEEERGRTLLIGLKKRWKMLDYKVRGYRTMNKERESNKMSAEAPSQDIIDSAEEASDLLVKIKELEGSKISKVEAYLNENSTKEAAEAIRSDEQLVETSGSFETTIGPRRPGRPRKDASSLTGNP